MSLEEAPLKDGEYERCFFFENVTPTIVKNEGFLKLGKHVLCPSLE